MRRSKLGALISLAVLLTVIPATPAIPVGTGGIRGFVWNDTNANGQFDSVEVGLPDFIVFIDVDDDNLLDQGEPQTTTDGIGSWDFGQLEAGDYVIRSPIPPGYEGTFPLAGNGEHRVTLGVGEIYDDLLLFGRVANATTTGTIEGGVWEDTDGDGAYGAIEPVMEGVTVYLDANSNGVLDGGETNTVTNVDGRYSFPDIPTGAKVVREVVPTGYTQTFPQGGAYFVDLTTGQMLDLDFANTPNGAIEGNVWNDADGDGTRDAGEGPWTGSLIVWLDHNDDGVHRTILEQAEFIDSSGNYRIDGLVPGEYVVRSYIRIASDPSPRTLTYPASGAHRVTVNLGETTGGADFGLYPGTGTSTIQGTTYEDANRNGVFDLDEDPINGVSVFLDLNDNGSHEAGEPLVRNGGSSWDDYQFGDIAPDSYLVRQIVPSGYEQTAPANGAAHLVDLSAGEFQADVDFGDAFPVELGSITGLKWEDSDGDGVFDAGEAPIPGVTIFLDANENGILDPGEIETVTDSSGSYLFDDLEPGFHVLSEVVPSGFTQTYPEFGLHNVLLEEGEALTGLDFGNQPGTPDTGSLAGSKWEDTDGDGERDAGEPPLEGVLVYLDLNADGTFDSDEPNTTTDASGDYVFQAIDDGAYLVREVVPPDYIQTYPSGDGSHDAIVAGGEAVTSLDFGNQPDAPEPVVIVVDETIAVFDDPDVLTSLLIQVAENIAVSDSVAVRPPVSIVVIEDIAVTDEVTVTPPVVLQVLESIAVGDAVLVEPEALAGISGVKWEDLDGDGSRDTGEPTVESVIIYLDLDDDGTLDTGEPWTATASDGSYAFNSLVPGEWVVREVVPTGFVQTFPDAGSTFEHRVVLTAGEVAGGLDFGNQLEVVGGVPPVVELVPDQEFTATVEGSFQVNATAQPEETLYYTVTQPPGEIDANGLFTWTPSHGYVGGGALVEITVATCDVCELTEDNSTSIWVTINVAPASPNPPVIHGPTGIQTFIAGVEGTFTIDATDADGDTLTYGRLPSPGIIDTNTGQFFWTPDTTDIGTIDIEFVVTECTGPCQLTPYNSDTTTITIEVVGGDGDEDADGIANSIDGQVDALDGFVSEATMPSSDFTDRHLAGAQPTGLGTSFGQIVDLNGEVPSVVDHSDPALGILVSVPGVPADGYSTFNFCGDPGHTNIWTGTTSIHTCGSHTVEVISGLVQLFTSDGAQIDIETGSQVRLVDDGSSVIVTVLVGEVTVTVGDSTVVLTDDDPPLENPGDALGDADDDGLTADEEALTGTDSENPDSDGDGLIDGIDASWLIDYLDDIPRSDFKRRIYKPVMKAAIATAAVLVNFGQGDTALAITGSLHSRVDGCGTSPDGNDWIIDCDYQVGFRVLLSLYERGVATLPLPNPFPWW